MNKFINKIPPIILLLILSVSGFLIGIFTVALWQENFLVSEQILGQEFMYRVADVTIDKRALFFLCFGKRLRAFFLLFLLAFSSVNYFTNVVFFFLNGLYIGSVMELFVIRYGVQGSLMYLSFILPHGIFYIIGFLGLGCWCLKLERVQEGWRNKKIGKIKSGLSKRNVIYAFLLVFVGILLESFMNSNVFFVFI